MPAHAGIQGAGGVREQQAQYIVRRRCRRGRPLCLPSGRATTGGRPYIVLRCQRPQRFVRSRATAGRPYVKLFCHP